MKSWLGQSYRKATVLVGAVVFVASLIGAGFFAESRAQAYVSAEVEDQLGDVHSSMEGGFQRLERHIIEARVETIELFSRSASKEDLRMQLESLRRELESADVGLPASLP